MKTKIYMNGNRYLNRLASQTNLEIWVCKRRHKKKIWILIFGIFTTITGSAVIVPEEMQEEAKQLFSLHQFNLVANEMMSMNRTVNDHRPGE